MDSIDQPDDDFFQAFIHSLRATCFQFLHFRDHVNIRGFISVEVDGTGQRHMVLAEKVARGPASVTASFPLQSFSCDVDTTTNASQCPQTAYSQNPLRRIGVCPPLPIGIQNNSPRHSSINTRRSCKSPRRCFIPGARCDSNNTTFTVEKSAVLLKKHVLDANRGLITPKRRVSTTTIDVSPSRSHLRQRDFPTNNMKCQSDISPSSAEEESEQKARNRCGVPSSRKRPHKSSTESSYNDSPIRPSISISIDDVSPVTLLEAAKVKSLIYNESRRKRDKHGKKSKQQFNRERAKANRELATQRRPLIHPFSCLIESDQECSITSVKPPYYLVNLADDVINTPSLIDNNVASDG